MFINKKNILLVFIGLIFFSCQNKSPQENKAVDSLSNSVSNQDDNLLDAIWNKYNFSENETNQFSDMLEQSLVEYIALFPNYSSDQINASLHELILKTESNPTSFGFFKDKFSYYLYHPNSPWRNDSYYEQVLTAYQKSDMLSATDKQRDQMVLSLVQKNQVGTLATDFDFVDNKAVVQKISDIKAVNKLLVFYDPTCPHCEELLQEMKQSDVLNEAIKSNNTIVIAIDPIGNVANWKAYQNNLPKEWINGFDKKGAILNNALYNILAYPTIYLLDYDNKIVQKDVYFQKVEGYLTKEN